ncbi:SLATT domain-containing protein [Psychrobacter proteolyticus]|uniref:SLATT domain-containing protein n=1 Tax=Psychrobacter proteolyticus TaxID=147825 RepID=UPI003D094FA9
MSELKTDNNLSKQNDSFSLGCKKIFQWVFSTQLEEREEEDPAKKLLNSMRITAKCRFNASVRLTRISKYSFLTTTILSLGLIFIPLYQYSGLSIPYSTEVLSMLQIFLAVAVLVYSVVNATAKYDLRAQALDDCGISIKRLVRKLRTAISQYEANNQIINLEKYHEKYHIIASEPENHTGVDYILAVLDTPSDFNITGLKRFLLYIRAYFTYSLPYIIPTSMMTFEVLFILDMLKITIFFENVFTITVG